MTASARTMLADSCAIATSLVVEDIVKRKYRNQEPRPPWLKPPLAESPFGMFPASYHMRDTWSGNNTVRRRERTKEVIKEAFDDPTSFLNRRTPKRLEKHVAYINATGGGTGDERRTTTAARNVVAGTPTKPGVGVLGNAPGDSAAAGAFDATDAKAAFNTVGREARNKTLRSPGAKKTVAPIEATATATATSGSAFGTSSIKFEEKREEVVPVHLRSSFSISGISVVHNPPPKPPTPAEKHAQKRTDLERQSKASELQAVKEYLVGQGRFWIAPASLVDAGALGSTSDRPLTAGPIRARRAVADKAKKCRVPSAGAFRKRPIEATLFRKYYERGDLPVKIDHCAGGNKLLWSGDVRTFDYHVYLPIFVDGLREVDDPYRFLSIQGVIDMIQAAPAKLLPVVPQLILPINNALATREPDIICSVLKILQQMLLQNPAIGAAFVPYFRSILPIFNLFRSCEKNMGDQFDYNQRRRLDLGELIRETLELFEIYGGPDAFINIKYMCPTYESCLLK